MNRSSRFFYALEKRRGAKKQVTCLLAEDGTPLTDPVEMQAVLALLPKKEDLRDLRNWRPVLLLSTDYKVVAKGILLRLGSMPATWSTQTYNVLGRSILDNMYLELMGLELLELELRLVLSAYADDVLLVVQDPGDLAWVEACQAIYSAASSTRVN
ncbi:unnamed protein product [Caretta caretta]